MKGCVIGLLLSSVVCIVAKVSVELENAAVSASDKVVFKIRPSVDVSMISLKSVKSIEGKSVGTAKKLEKKGKHYILDLSSSPLPPGVYNISLDISGEKSSRTVKTLIAKIVSIVELTFLSVNKIPLKASDSISNTKLSSRSGDKLEVEFKVTPKGGETELHPHQCFLLLTHGDGNETFFACAKGKVSVDLVNDSKLLGYKSGEYRVTLILGDSAYDSAIIRDLGSIGLSLGSAPPERHVPLYKKPLLHESDSAISKLPEIVHKMKQAEARPPTYVSDLVTVSVVFPFLAFVKFCVSRHGSFSLFPSRLPEQVCSVLFVTALASILAILAAYWVRLTFYDTMSLLGPVAVVTILLGRSALLARGEAAENEQRLQKKE